MGKYEATKKVVLNYFDKLQKAAPDEVEAVLDECMSSDYDWKASYPFRELKGNHEIATTFWKPMKEALDHMERRMDVFIGGSNELSEEEEKWTMCMGHFMGNFKKDFLGIRHTGKMASIRFAEFTCVKDGKVVKTGLFMDFIGLMLQAGMHPLPASTGQYYIYPGPRMHNGLLFEDAPEEEGVKTMQVVDQMVEDLDKLNRSGSLEPPTAEDLAHSWSENMIWFGPAGIGASYTIPGYIEQHTGPFRRGLGDKAFNGHVVRFSEGNFACFFGWPNLSNRNIGGFLGLTSGDVRADMQVVDVYSREGDKLAENWVVMDIPYWLKQQGLDIFQRTSEIENKK